MKVLKVDKDKSSPTFPSPERGVMTAEDNCALENKTKKIVAQLIRINIISKKYYQIA